MQTLPKHIEWTLNKYSTALALRLEQDGRLNGRPDDLHAAIESFMEADPTPRKFLVEWLVKGYLGLEEEGYSEPAFRWEDVENGKSSRVYHTLSLFTEHFKKLPASERDLSEYKNLGKVHQTVAEFIPQAEVDNSPSGKALKRMERERALAQSRVLVRTEEMIVAVPLSVSASQWWGKGTQWCSS